jgi:hypothetical protein
VLRELTRLRALEALVGRAGRWPVVRQAVNLAAGYNRVFPDYASAREFAGRYSENGHDAGPPAPYPEVEYDRFPGDQTCRGRATEWACVAGGRRQDRTPK